MFWLLSLTFNIVPAIAFQYLFLLKSVIDWHVNCSFSFLVEFKVLYSIIFCLHRQSRSDDVRGSPRLTVTSLFVAVNIIGMHALCFFISPDTSQVSLQSLDLYASHIECNRIRGLGVGPAVRRSCI